MQLLARMRIASRLHLIVTAMIVGLILVGGSGILALRDNLIEDRQAKTRDLVQTALSVVRAQHRRVQAGEIDEAQAKREALTALSTMRYEDDNYFWVNDLQPRMVMHPQRPDLDGRDLSDFRDVNGLPLFVEFARIARENGAGFVFYQWPKPGHEAPVGKLSYVEIFAPWGWVIGSGIYLDDVDTIFRNQTLRFALVILLGAFGTAGLAWMISRGISQPLSEITKRMVRLAGGERGLAVPYTERIDEVGELARALQVFKDNAERVDELRRLRDATERRAAAEIRASEERVRLLLDSTGEGIYAIDRQGLCTVCNPSALRLLGYTSVDQVLGQDMHAVAHHSRPDGTHYPVAGSQVRHALNGQAVLVDDEMLWRADGTGFPAEYRAHPIQRDGEVIGAVVTFLDITERRQVEESMRLANTVFNTTSEAIVVTDSHNRIKAVNPAFTRITGYAPAEVLGRDPKVLESGRHEEAFFREMWASLQDGDHWEGEIWNRRKNGEVYPEWLSITPIRNHAHDIVEYVAVFTDITLRKRDEERVRWHANHDALTELPNRTCFLDSLSRAASRAQSSRTTATLLFLDLDRFKAVNDQMGHAVGDKLLQMAAKRLRRSVRETDLVGRLGGDEFTVLLEDLSNGEEAVLACEKIIDSLNQPFHIDGHVASIGVSIGIAVLPTDAEEPLALLEKADIAMYRAKESGRNIFRFYSADFAKEQPEALGTL